MVVSFLFAFIWHSAEHDISEEFIINLLCIWSQSWKGWATLAADIRSDWWIGISLGGAKETPNTHYPM